jgi:hypothetical protein
LTPVEQGIYDKGQLIVKGNTKVGHRTFTAYHPSAFINKLIGFHQILEHTEGDIKNGKPQQDIWIIKVIK